MHTCDLHFAGCMGHATAHVSVIEFQKRGLPHAHLLLWVTDRHKLRSSDDYDTAISAELPDKDDPNEQLLYDTVTRYGMPWHALACLGMLCKLEPNAVCPKLYVAGACYTAHVERTPSWASTIPMPHAAKMESAPRGTPIPSNRKRWTMMMGAFDGHVSEV
jgi:hypothetical protein